MTSDTDTTDLLGCFEQVDVHRKRRAFLVELNAFYQDLMRALLVWGGHEAQGRALVTQLRSAKRAPSAAFFPPLAHALAVFFPCSPVAFARLSPESVQQRCSRKQGVLWECVA
jgi:hypothetical protein